MSKETNDTRAPKEEKLNEEDQNEMEGGSSNVEDGLVEDNKQIVEIATTATPTIEQPSPKIFKLDIDCFDEIFEYLSLYSLNAFSQTCKPMHKVVGEYFKRNYLDAELNIIFNKLYVKTNRNENLFSGLKQYVSKIFLNGYEQQPHLYFKSRQNELEPIRHLSMVHCLVYNEGVNVIYRIFPKLETIQLKSVSIYGNLYEIMLQHCENLKILHLEHLENLVNIDNNDETRCPWTRKKYTNLEYLELSPIVSMNELNFFFDLNPNVRNFSTDAESIWRNSNEILKSKIQLDLLVIMITNHLSFTEHFVLLFDVLNQLYDKGFYKRLHIHDYGYEIHKSSSVALDSLYGSIEKVSIRSPNAKNIHLLPDLTNLKLLEISDSTFNDMKSIETKFKNLEGLFMNSANYDHIPSYIRSVVQQLPKLKIFRIDSEDSSSEGHILKLKTLNEEREKLFEARKLTIYVPDDTFLKTKWNVENGNINLHLIEMKKFSSCKCFNHWGTEGSTIKFNIYQDIYL